MPDREKVIKSVDICRGNGHCEDCQYYQGHAGYTIMDCRKYLLNDALALLKEQDKRYAMMVVDWLKDMAHNNYLDSSHMTFWDAILDIRERAQTGLENYFRDYDSGIKQQGGR